jgi:short-subunit dehydrogenase involved in D-alanine esterification of teichoic acids
MRLAERRILVTGGGSGIGLALARALAPENTVVIAGRDERKLEEARASTPRFRTLRLDVTSEEDARRAIGWVDEQLGGLDLLVNSAGVFRSGGFDDPGAEQAAFEEVEINQLGSVRMTRLALPLLRRSDDAGVVLLSSALALVSAPRMAVYAATKAAIHSLARSLRNELDGRVKVFDVLPPWVESELSRTVKGAKITPDEVAAEILAGLRKDRFEIRVGRIKQLAVIGRISPKLADSIAARATG